MGAPRGDYPRFPRNTHPPAFAELWCQLPRPGLPTVTRLPSVIPWRLSGRVFREASHRSRTRPPTPQRSRSLAALGSKRALPHVSRGRVLRLSRRKSISDPPALASAALGMINTISRDQFCRFRIGLRQVRNLLIHGRKSGVGHREPDAVARIRI